MSLQDRKRLVNALGEISPFLGFAAGALLIAAFFGVFWLRRKYQDRR
jgi:hypothetical protein